MFQKRSFLLMLLVAIAVLTCSCAARGFGQAKVRARGAVGTPAPRRPPQVVVQVVNNTTNLHLDINAPGIYEGGGSGCILLPGRTCDLEFYPPQGTRQSVTMAISVRGYKDELKTEIAGVASRSFWLRGVPWGSGIGGTYSWPRQRVYVMTVDWVRGAMTYKWTGG